MCCGNDNDFYSMASLTGYLLDKGCNDSLAAYLREIQYRSLSCSGRLLPMYENVENDRVFVEVQFV